MPPACNDGTVVQAGLRASPHVRAVWPLGLALSCCLTIAAGSSRAQVPCPSSQTSFAVTAEHSPPVIKSSYTSADLRLLASQAAYRGPHPPWGFYAGTFGYGVEVSPPEAQGCAVTVMVRLFLAPRLIEVSRDGPCRPEMIAEHYLLHARQDDLLLSRYAALTRDMLDSGQRPSGRPGDSGRDAVIRSVSTALDRLLEPFDEDRKRALAAADTEEELARLARRCSHAT